MWNTSAARKTRQRTSAWASRALSITSRTFSTSRPRLRKSWLAMPTNAVKRRSSLVRLGKLAGPATEAVQQQIRRPLGRYTDRIRTVTVVNGKELAGDAGISRELGCDVYFANPKVWYRRGTSENCSGSTCRRDGI